MGQIRSAVTRSGVLEALDPRHKERVATRSPLALPLSPTCARRERTAERVRSGAGQERPRPANERLEEHDAWQEGQLFQASLHAEGRQQRVVLAFRAAVLPDAGRTCSLVADGEVGGVAGEPLHPSRAATRSAVLPVVVSRDQHLGRRSLGWEMDKKKQRLSTLDTTRGTSSRQSPSQASSVLSPRPLRAQRRDRSRRWPREALSC